MAQFLELNAIDLRAEREAQEQGGIIAYLPAPTGLSDDRFSGLDYDDLERPVPINVPIYPVQIAVNQIREFYPRKNNVVGTRIVYPNGAATVVKETYDEVKTALQQLVFSSYAVSPRAN